MSWRIKSIFLFLLLIPSFIGYPFNIFESHILFSWAEPSVFSGPTDGQLLYLCLVVILIPLISGSQILILGLTTGALVSLSILFAGGLIAYIKTNFGIHGVPTSPYYIAKYINIITVVPLSLALFMTIPFMQFERSILSSSNGVTMKQKVLLMIVRVINNVRYSVIPDIWSVLAEENINKNGNQEFGTYVEEAMDGKDITLRKRIKKVVSKNMYIAASGIAESLEFIPLWAVEISKLPTKKREG